MAAVLFLDIDHFKHVNDSLGHAVGDKLLQAVAACLAACVRASDTVSRQGGDEFIVLLSELQSIEDARRVAEKIGAALALPRQIDRHELRVTASIGISVYPTDGELGETLIDRADTAMYYAKEQGRSNHQFFTREVRARVVERVTIENRLHHAVERREFVLHYQPKMDLHTESMVGAEALIRWAHPDLGLIFPTDFIPIAEQCGLIVPIGQWVMREGCRQAKAWADAGLRGPLPLALNISAMQFRHPHFLKGFCQILKETELDPSYIELELTESVLMHDSATTATVLKALKGMGVKLAIDDFGTGYSSLSYLRQFPIDKLKIDQSFVNGITHNSDDAAIVGAVISMGTSLNRRVIAEGVETMGQLAFLRAHQCHEGQGSYFSKPLSENDFTRFMQRQVRSD